MECTVERGALELCLPALFAPAVVTCAARVLSNGDVGVSSEDSCLLRYQDGCRYKADDRHLARGLASFHLPPVSFCEVAHEHDCDERLTCARLQERNHLQQV
jgi:hypothetical protein